MRDIRASAEVVALIGTESLRELEKDAFRSYECAECGSGLTTDATSVVVHRYRGTAMVRLAHARCTQPKIVEFDADAPPSTRPEETGGYARASDLNEAAQGSLAGGLVACPHGELSGSGPGPSPAELASRSAASGAPRSHERNGDGSSLASLFRGH